MENVQIFKIFTCTECGGHQIYEKLVGAVVSSQVVAYDVVEGLAYGGCEHDIGSGGEVAGYFCDGCGSLVAETQEDLLKLLGIDSSCPRDNA